MKNIIADYKSAYGYLNSSPMFKLSLSSKELFHSNFLEWLSNVDREGFEDLINKMAGVSISWPKVWRVKREFNNFDICVVAYDQYDDYMDERIDDDEHFRVLFVIENKVKSIPYKSQLDRYRKEAFDINKTYWSWLFSHIISPKEEKYDSFEYKEGKWFGRKKKGNGKGKKAEWQLFSLDIDINPRENLHSLKRSAFNNMYNKCKQETNPIYFILLSLAKDFPENDSIDKWSICYYKQYQGQIKDSFKRKAKGLSYNLIDDYCQFIMALSVLSDEWSTDYEKEKPYLYYNVIGKTKVYNKLYQDAHKYRIHDLYQKLKYSHLCAKLFTEINREYGKEYTVLPSNQGGLFKDKNFIINKVVLDKYICVNYAYMHGEPLLEINIHPSKNDVDTELYYAIQVQGNAYEHGIQVKRIQKERYELTKKGKDDIAKYVWDRLIGKIRPEMRIIDNWMTLSDSSPWSEECDFLADEEKKPEGKPYNEYNQSDGAYLYQHKIIKPTATIDSIITKMLKDLAYVIDKLKKA